MKLHELSGRPGPPNAQAHRPRHRLRQRQDRRPRRQGPDRALRRAHQRLRRRPDAAASPAAQARLQEHRIRPQAQRGESRPLQAAIDAGPARCRGQDRRRGAGQGRHPAPGQGRRAAARRRRNQGQGDAFGVRRLEIGGRRGGEGRRFGRNPRAQGGDETNRRPDDRHARLLCRASTISTCSAKRGWPVQARP